jgi:hypothetical protein
MVDSNMKCNTFGYPVFGFQPFIGFGFGIPPLPFGKGTEGKGLTDVMPSQPSPEGE